MFITFVDNNYNYYPQILIFIYIIMTIIFPFVDISN